MQTPELLVETIGSGSYAVSSSRAGSFQCHLGTRVGIALFDSENNVGGLYHIILPEPVETGTVWEPENYASTGMPLFLRELYDRGAQQESITISRSEIQLPAVRQSEDLGDTDRAPWAKRYRHHRTEPETRKIL